MNNETMLSISIQAFLEYKTDTLEFEKIFNHVKKFFFETWKEKNYAKLSDEELLEKKRGELYKLLTIDQTFSHMADGKWSIVHVG